MCMLRLLHSRYYYNMLYTLYSNLAQEKLVRATNKKTVTSNSLLVLTNNRELSKDKFSGSFMDSHLTRTRWATYDRKTNENIERPFDEPELQKCLRSRRLYDGQDT